MFAIHSGRALAAALVLSVVPAGGFAATFDVRQQRSNISDDGTGVKKSVAGQISTPSSTKLEVNKTTAGSFHPKKRPAGSNTVCEAFTAFCVAVSQSIRTGTRPAR